MARAPATHIEIDPASATPLYQQIAEAIRARIESGELAAGDALAPLREAAEQWGVNLHTVRHAYTALSREGLIETRRGARGTRVLKRGDDRQTAFVSRVLEEAETLGLSRNGLIDALRAHAGAASGRAVVYVVECSERQCEAHARQIARAFDVDARPWVLDEEDEPPSDGAIVATYFHYNDIRRLWPQRLRDVRFLTITPKDDALATCAQVGATRLVVVEQDEPTARNVAADVLSLEGADRFVVETVVTEDVDSVLSGLGQQHAALLAPRVWASASESTRRDRRVIEIEYAFDGDELASLGQAMRWRTV